MAELQKTSRIPEPQELEEGPAKKYLNQLGRVLRNNFQNLENLITKSMDLIASNVVYDNTASGLSSTDVQAALDEIVTITGVAPAASSVTYNNATSGLTATNVQAAIDEIDAELDTFGSPSNYATAAQGAKADTALQPNTQLVRQAHILVDTTNRSTASTSYTASGVTTSLPSNLASTSSRVKVTVCGVIGASTTGAVVQLTIYRNGSAVTPSGVGGFTAAAGIDGGHAAPFSFTFIDSPASVTPATYEIYYRTSTGLAYLGRRNDDTAIDMPTSIVLEELTS